MLSQKSGKKPEVMQLVIKISEKSHFWDLEQLSSLLEGSSSPTTFLAAEQKQLQLF